VAGTKIPDGVAVWARQVLDLQNACNSGGVASTLGDLMQFLSGQPEYEGTGWRNEHPLVVVVLDKLCSLASIQPAFPDRRVVEAFTVAALLADCATQDQKDHIQFNSYYAKYVEPVQKRRKQLERHLAEIEAASVAAYKAKHQSCHDVSGNDRNDG